MAGTRALGTVGLFLLLAASGCSSDSKGAGSHPATGNGKDSGAGNDAGGGPHVAYDGTPLADGFDPPSPPDDALQLVSTIIPDVKPGANTEFCYYTNHILEEPTTFRAGQGYQTKGGHHVVVYWGAVPQPEGVHECTEADMIALHVLSGGGAESGNGIINELPAGGAFQVPKGAQLVMNIHVINTTEDSLQTQAVANLYYGDESLAALSSFYVSGTDLNIAPHSAGSFETSCVAAQDFKAVRLLGHMHEWGTRSRVILDDGTGPVTVYDRPGSTEFSFNPPYIDFPVAEPYLIKKGTKITAKCDYQNDTEAPLVFPTEMCAAFGYTLGTDAEHGCANGEWNQ